jgi:single-stranded DNA-specific DHH superfamily exonuclease
MFERIGGHAQAFGFTARKDRMPEIISTINHAIDDKYQHDENIKIDALIDITDINSTLIGKLSVLEPLVKTMMNLFLQQNQSKLNHFHILEVQESMENTA